MNCANHPQTPATAYCRTCGKPLCAGCQRVVNGVIYCEQCIAERLGTPAAVAGAPGPIAPPIMSPIAPPADGHTPSPGLAAVLGFIPGVGAIYNGQFVKGIAHVAIFIALVWAANQVDWVGFLVACWIFYMVFDAYKTARARELGQPLPDPFGFENLWEGGRRAYSTPHPTVTPTPPGSFTPADAGQPAAAGFVPGSVPPEAAQPSAPEVSRPGAPIGAIVLISLGALFLLNSIENFSLWWLNRYWIPAALIALGIWIFFRQRSRAWACPCSRCTARGLMGPALLVLTGVLWLISEFSRGRWSLHETWPIYLIVIGGILVMRHSASDEGHIPYPERLNQLGRHVDDRIRSRMEKREMARDFFQQRVENRDAATQPDSGGAAPDRTNDEVHNG